jgi:hypothetical protein
MPELSGSKHRQPDAAGSVLPVRADAGWPDAPPLTHPQARGQPPIRGGPHRLIPGPGNRRGFCFGAHCYGF